MRETHIKSPPCQNRPGYAVLIMILLIVVICTIIWLDPTALFSRSDPDLPWNQEFRLVKADEQVGAPAEEQPQITKPLVFKGRVMKEDSRRGKIEMALSPNGRIKGGWTGEFYPDPDVNYLVMGCNFKGNIDPSNIYEDQEGQDPSMLYFMTKGSFLILSTNQATAKTKKVAGYIYLTGWLDSQYYATAEVTMTSDKKSCQTLSWEARGQEAASVPWLLKLK